MTMKMRGTKRQIKKLERQLARAEAGRDQRLERYGYNPAERLPQPAPVIPTRRIPADDIYIYGRDGYFAQGFEPSISSSMPYRQPRRPAPETTWSQQPSYERDRSRGSMSVEKWRNDIIGY